jgi:hypothetical protein
MFGKVLLPKEYHLGNRLFTVSESYEGGGRINLDGTSVEKSLEEYEIVHNSKQIVTLICFRP